MKNNFLAFLMLTAMFFGCKPRTQELRPQQSTIDSDLIEQAKTYFENAQSVALTKTVEVSLGARDNRVNFWAYPAFRTFQPIWNKTEQVNLLNGNKVLITPVRRNLKVDYNNLFYIRRLRIELNAQNQIVKANIVELVTLKRSVASQKYQIIANVFEEIETRTDAQIMVYDAGYTPLLKNGSSWKGEATNNSNNANNRGRGDDNPIPPPTCYYLTAVASCTDVQYLANIAVYCDGADPNTVFGVGAIVNNCQGGGSGSPWTPPSDPNNPPFSGQTGNGGGDIGQDEPFDPYYMPPNFEDPNGVYLIYKKTIQDKRDEYRKVIQDSTKSEKAKSEARILYNEYNEAIKELKKIEQSTFKYHISRDINREDGYTQYNPTLNRIEIVLPRPTQDGTRGLEGHEFKHAHQFETGKISFNKTTGGVGKAYDLHDEKEAFQRWHTFRYDYRSFFVDYKGTLTSYNPYGYQITLADVLTIGLQMTPVAYQNLSSTPKDVASLLAAGEDMSTDVYVNPNP